MKRAILLSLIAAPFIMVGCGGGSSSSSTATLAKITGTVPGTLIEAFCADGTYAQVTSTQNGTTQHPFEISVPQNVECRLVMTTNENDPVNRIITPIGFATATATGLTVSLNQDLNLGHVPLPLDPNTVTTNNQVVVDPLLVDINSTTSTVNNAPIYDNNSNGIIDAYEDHNGNGRPDAYDDDDGDGIDNLHDDDDDDGRPNHIDDENDSNDDNKDSSDNDNDDNKGSTNDNTQTNGTTYIDDNEGSNDNDNDDYNKGSSDNDNDDDHNNDRDDN